jgi:hypothetical protein
MTPPGSEILVGHELAGTPADIEGPGRLARTRPRRSSVK